MFSLQAARPHDTSASPRVSSYLQAHSDSTLYTVNHSVPCAAHAILTLDGIPVLNHAVILWIFKHDEAEPFVSGFMWVFKIFHVRQHRTQRSLTLDLSK